MIYACMIELKPDLSANGIERVSAFIGDICMHACALIGDICMYAHL